MNTAISYWTAEMLSSGSNILFEFFSGDQFIFWGSLFFLLIFLRYLIRLLRVTQP